MLLFPFQRWACLFLQLIIRSLHLLFQAHKYSYLPSNQPTPYLRFLFQAIPCSCVWGDLNFCKALFPFVNLYQLRYHPWNLQSPYHLFLPSFSYVLQHLILLLSSHLHPKVSSIWKLCHFSWFLQVWPRQFLGSH